MKQQYKKPFAERIDFEAKTAIMNDDTNVDEDEDIDINQSIVDEW